MPIFTPNHKKWARYQGGSTGPDGFLTGLVSNVGTVGRSLSTTNGTATTFASAATNPASAGVLNATVTLLARALNPVIYCKLAISALTNTRVFIGFQNVATSPTGEDAYNGNTKACFVFGKLAASTNWQIMTQNLTAQATQFTDTGVAIGADAAVHTLELVADDANSGFTWSLDGTSPALITASVPATGTGIAPIVELETAEAVAKTFSMFDLQCYADK